MATTLPSKARSVCSVLLSVAIALVLTRGVDAGALAGAKSEGSAPFLVLDRAIVQDQGDWQVDYHIRYDGQEPLMLMADDVSLRVDGWVSNSRVPGHATPRLSSTTLAGGSGLQGSAEVIASDDEERRCRERTVLKFWANEADGPGPARTTDLRRGGRGPDEADTSAQLLDLDPGSTFHVRLRLEHRHVVYGSYDPLLGRRIVELGLGRARIRDELPLDREHHVAQPPRVAFEAPEDRRDTQFFRSAPDSLHLAAHLPGHSFFRFPEIPVRYGSKIRLRFSYLIALGTEGPCRARITQYMDSPIAWKVLKEGRREVLLSQVGRWTQVEMLIQAEPDATTLALDFRIEGADIDAGELWIDDVTLEPIGVSPDKP